MRPDTLLKTDKTTLAVEASKDGKIKIASSAWTDAVVVLPDQVIELRWRAGQVHVLRRPKLAEPEDGPKLAGADDPYGEHINGEPMSHSLIETLVTGIRNEFARAHPAKPSKSTLMRRLNEIATLVEALPDDEPAPAAAPAPAPTPVAPVVLPPVAQPAAPTPAPVESAPVAPAAAPFAPAAAAAPAPAPAPAPVVPPAAPQAPAAPAEVTPAAPAAPQVHSTAPSALAPAPAPAPSSPAEPVAATAPAAPAAGPATPPASQ
jgi:hypothetical protein